MPANLDFFLLTATQSFSIVPEVFNDAATKAFDKMGADVDYLNNDEWNTYSIVTLNIFHRLSIYFC